MGRADGEGCANAHVHIFIRQSCMIGRLREPMALPLGLALSKHPQLMFDKPAAVVDIGFSVWKGRPPGRRRSSWFLALPVLLVAFLFSVRSSAATWSLLGAAEKGSLIEPLGSHRGLVCGPQNCAIWDVATGTSSSTVPIGVTSSPGGHVRLSDGSVLVVFGVRSSPPLLWNPASGRWLPTVPLPESLDRVHLAVLVDGRVIISGRSQSDGSLRAYVADRDVTRWSTLTPMPARTAPNSELLPTPSGLVLLESVDGKPRLSRYAATLNTWTPVTLPAGRELGDKPGLTTWGDRVVIVARNILRLDVLLIAPEQTTTREVAWPPIGDLHVEPISSFDGSDMLLLGDGNDLLLWRKPEESPLRLPRSAIGAQRALAAVDARHLIGLGPAGALVLATLEGPAPPAGACDGLDRYLRQAGDGTPSSVQGPLSGANVSVDIALVGDACRDRIHRGDMPDVPSLIRRWASQPEPEWRDLGQRFSCAAEDPAALPEVAAWLSSKTSELTRAVCIARLPYWPGAALARRDVFQNLVQQIDGIWQVDPGALLAAQEHDSVALWDLLVPAVATGKERRAVGAEALERRVCSDLRKAAPERQKLCAERASQRERSEKPEPVNHTPVPKLALDILAGVAVGGLAAGTYVARESDVGRGIATASGVLGGAVIGAAIGALPAYIYGMKTRHDDATPAFLIAGSVVGGVLGGFAAYAVSTSSSARAPTTAVCLAIPFLVVIALPVD